MIEDPERVARFAELENRIDELAKALLRTQARLLAAEDRILKLEAKTNRG